MGFWDAWGVYRGVSSPLKGRHSQRLWVAIREMRQGHLGGWLAGRALALLLRPRRIQTRVVWSGGNTLHRLPRAPGVTPSDAALCGQWPNGEWIDSAAYNGALRAAVCPDCERLR